MVFALVAKSTVTEVILAQYCGMKASAVPIATNMAAGMSKTALSHEQTMDSTAAGTAKGQILHTTLLQV